MVPRRNDKSRFASADLPRAGTAATRFARGLSRRAPVMADLAMLRNFHGGGTGDGIGVGVVALRAAIEISQIGAWPTVDRRGRYSGDRCRDDSGNRRRAARPVRCARQRSTRARCRLAARVRRPCPRSTAAPSSRPSNVTREPTSDPNVTPSANMAAIRHTMTADQVPPSDSAAPARGAIRRGSGSSRIRHRRLLAVGGHGAPVARQVSALLRSDGLLEQFRAPAARLRPVAGTRRTCSRWASTGVSQAVPVGNGPRVRMSNTWSQFMRLTLPIQIARRRPFGAGGLDQLCHPHQSPTHTVLRRVQAALHRCRRFPGTSSRRKTAIAARRPARRSTATRATRAGRALLGQ